MPRIPRDFTESQLKGDHSPQQDGCQTSEHSSRPSPPRLAVGRAGSGTSGRTESWEEGNGTTYFPINLPTCVCVCEAAAIRLCFVSSVFFHPPPTTSFPPLSPPHPKPTYPQPFRAFLKMHSIFFNFHLLLFMETSTL